MIIDTLSRNVKRQLLPTVQDTVSTKKEPSPAEQLREAREAAGLTQEAAADLLGVTGRTISRWETGGTVGQPELFAALTSYRTWARQAGRLVGPDGAEGHVDTMSWEDAVATDAAEDWLDGYRRRLRPYVRQAVERDRFVDLMRRAGAGFSADGSLALWTVNGAIGFMERIAERVIEGLKASGTPPIRLVAEDDDHIA